MKKIIIPLSIYFLLTLFITSCHHPTNKEKIIGSWKLSIDNGKPATGSIIVSFYKNGTITTNENEGNDKLTYKFTRDDNHFELYEKERLEKEFEILELTETKFRFNLKEKGIAEFVRIPE